MFSINLRDLWGFRNHYWCVKANLDYKIQYKIFNINIKFYYIQYKTPDSIIVNKRAKNKWIITTTV